MTFWENHFLYFPHKYPTRWVTPDVYDLPFEDVELTSRGGCRIHGWWLPADGAAFTLLFCHGNAFHIGNRLPFIRFLRDHVTPAFNIFIFDYRGYGRSTGRPSESGLYADARTALDHVLTHRDTPPERLVYLGRSLGSAVAVQLATEYTPAALILECPLLSAHEMSKVVFKYLRIPPVLIRQRFDNLSKIKDIHCPLMILHGDRDLTVPYEHGVRLYQAARDPRRFVRIPGADHCRFHEDGGDIYINAWTKFLSEQGFTTPFQGTPAPETAVRS